MPKIIFCILFNVCIYTVVFCQNTNGDTTKTSFSMGFEGMIATSFSKDLVALNLGGPSIFFKLTRHIKIGGSALPSMVVFNNKLGVRLGMAPRIDYKKIVFMTPFYQDNAGAWIWTFGVGYKF